MGVMLVAACSENASTSTSTSAAPSAAANAQLLRYTTALPHYQIDLKIKTPPGSLVSFDIARTIDIELTGNERFVRARIAATDPLAAYDLRDAAEVVLLMFPELPKDPVTNGTTWRVPRGIMVPGREQPVDLAHTVTYRETSCSSGTRPCARLYVDADARNTRVRVDDTTWLVLYSFSGTSDLDPQRGIVERAELHVTANIANGPTNVTVNATAVAIPTGPRD